MLTNSRRTAIRAKSSAFEPLHENGPLSAGNVQRVDGKRSGCGDCGLLTTCVKSHAGNQPRVISFATASSNRHTNQSRSVCSALNVRRTLTNREGVL
ncbi:hypothetical protein KCP70_20405 [Salmonella enterica subsp. enterica]|nr:hypothetical protein KCP70_20405 [Salmonella enterica subsp. enterica]